MLESRIKAFNLLEIVEFNFYFCDFPDKNALIRSNQVLQLFYGGFLVLLCLNTKFIY